MSLVEFTRLLVIFGYGTVALYGLWSARTADTAQTKLAAWASVVIGALWAGFYIVVYAAAPLTLDQTQMATYFSRMNHAPVIAALALMLYSQHRKEKVYREVAEESRRQGVG